MIKMAIFLQVLHFMILCYFSDSSYGFPALDIGKTPINARMKGTEISADQKLDDFSQDCLESHNKYRAKHGVAPLVWSTDLAESANMYAKQIALDDKFEHDQMITEQNVGENLARFYPAVKKCEKAKIDDCVMCREMVKAWYDEIKNYNFDDGTGKIPEMPFSKGTQILWAGTSEIGVGTAASSKLGFITVARYRPGGNKGGHEGYKQNVPPLGGPLPTIPSKQQHISMLTKPLLNKAPQIIKPVEQLNTNLPLSGKLSQDTGAQSNIKVTPTPLPMAPKTTVQKATGGNMSPSPSPKTTGGAPTKAMPSRPDNKPSPTPPSRAPRVSTQSKAVTKAFPSPSPPTKGAITSNNPASKRPGIIPSQTPLPIPTGGSSQTKSPTSSTAPSGVTSQIEPEARESDYDLSPTPPSVTKAAGNSNLSSQVPGPTVGRTAVTRTSAPAGTSRTPGQQASQQKELAQEENTLTNYPINDRVHPGLVTHTVQAGDGSEAKVFLTRSGKHAGIVFRHEISRKPEEEREVAARPRGVIYVL